MFEYDTGKMDVERIIDFILSSYWGKGLGRAELEQAFESSYCLALLSSQELVGFARAVSDKYTSAYIRDFFVFEEHQKCGYGKLLWEGLSHHPDLVSVQNWYLGTKDAHGFYAKCGFQSSPDGIYMSYRRI
jgi:GNAT superfamily N-acetyltransferase